MYMSNIAYIHIFNMAVDWRYMLLDDNLVPLARMKITDRHRQNDDSDLRSIYLFRKNNNK